MKDLKELCKEKIVIVAHRGSSAGNIPCNTMAAYQIAYRQGADMLEIDLNMTKDGKLVIFHPGEERNHLGFCGSIRNYTWEEIQKVLRYVNFDRTQTEWSLCSFEEVLETFKDKCYINVDKFWDFPVEISKAIKRHHMMDQIVVKAKPMESVINALEEIAPEIMFLPIYKNVIGDAHEWMKSKKINYVGAELVFSNEECETAQESFIEKLHQEGRIAWANAILYDYRVPLTAGHTDDISLIEDPSKGWGWLADRNFDLIQTDWVMAMKKYLEDSGKLFKK